jgi:flagellar biosynthesis protein FliQ
MGADRALFFLNQLVWTAMAIGAPILIGVLLVGLVVSVLQVATQIQEITLSYVPKLIVCALLLIGLGPWMLSRLTQYAISLYQTIPTIGE